MASFGRRNFPRAFLSEDYSFSPYAKFSGKPIFLTPWCVHVRVRIIRLKCQFIEKFCVRTELIIPLDNSAACSGKNLWGKVFNDFAFLEDNPTWIQFSFKDIFVMIKQRGWCGNQLSGVRAIFRVAINLWSNFLRGTFPGKVFLEGGNF